MKLAHKIDTNKYMLEPVLVDDSFVNTSDTIVNACPNGFYKPQWNGTQWIDAQPLTNTQIFQQEQNAKQSEIDNAYAQATKTFKSSATGSSLTYLVEDGVTMAKFNAQYIYATSSLYNGNPFNFYTIENGGVSHTKDQFLQVWQNGHDYMQSQFIKWDNKTKQYKACTITNNQLNSIVWNDTTAPSIPTGLTGTAGTTQATLSWTANSEIDVQIGGGYNVYKTGVKVNTAPITATSYTVTGLTTGTAVSFTLSAVDSDGNESPQSTSVSVTPL